jgi:hypothetical protein
MPFSGDNLKKEKYSKKDTKARDKCKEKEERGNMEGNEK